MRKSNKKAAFSLVEIIVVIGMVGVLLGIVAYSSHRSADNRSLDLNSKKIEAALQQTKQKAVNDGGASIVFTLPKNGQAGNWEIRDHSGNRVATDTIPQQLDLTISPSSSRTLYFSQAGSASADTSFQVKAVSTGKVVSFKLYQATGAIERVNE